MLLSLRVQIHAAKHRQDAVSCWVSVAHHSHVDVARRFVFWTVGATRGSSGLSAVAFVVGRSELFAHQRHVNFGLGSHLDGLAKTCERGWNRTPWLICVAEEGGDGKKYARQ